MQAWGAKRVIDYSWRHHEDLVEEEAHKQGFQQTSLD